MKTKTYKPHPAAKAFPILPDAELAELAADIAANGQHEPIVVTADGLVLDGRNRLEACRIAKVEPEILLWDREDDGISATAWVKSKNLHRRHLNPSQKAMIAADLVPLFEAEAKKRQLSGVPATGQRGTAVGQAAAAHGATERSVARARAVIASAPKAEIEKIRLGEKTLKQVERETKRTEQVKQARAYVAPAGQFPVIVTDYPWKYDDALEGSDAVRGGCPYPPMTIAEICALPLPVADSCALFMWVTNSHLIDPEAYAVVARSLKDQYGLVPKQIRAWNKPHMGVGHVWRNDTEHLVRFERGRPVFAKVTQRTGFDGALGEHSEKPQRAYDDIAALCPAGPRLEMFARAPREGWVTSGSELQKDLAAAELHALIGKVGKHPTKEELKTLQELAATSGLAKAKVRKLLIVDRPTEAA